MAIDTRQKRTSALKGTLPAPDGTLDQGDRQHILWQYAGIAAEPLTPTEPMRIYQTKTREYVFSTTTRAYSFPATTRGPLA